MGVLTRVVRPLSSVLVISAIAMAATPAVAQTQTDEFVTGRAAQAWERWQAALKAVLAQDQEPVEAAFGELLETDPSPLRMALLEEHTTQRAASGGAVLLLEQDYDQEELGENAGRVVELLRAGREQMNQADDGWYFASIGRFDVAAANFRELFKSEVDPVALLEFADRLPRRHAILVQLAGHPVMGEPVRNVLAALREGERIVKSDPVRIKRNIERLGGPPRAFENGVALLKDSGEYAPPFLIEALRDPDRQELLLPILRCLPQIDRPALNPLVAALELDDDTVKLYIIKALGQIGYIQAAPYLLQLLAEDETAPQVRTAARAALDELAVSGTQGDAVKDAADAMLGLAEMYYDDHRTVAADPLLEWANVWYWRDDILQNVEVPTDIFNEVMAMRLCEKALLLNPDHTEALSLWLAANLRREAQLGDRTDNTRPDVFPTGVYFAQSAGAEYCQRALARALKDGDPAVALGAIAALRKTAGPASLFSGEHAAPPLAQALSFPNRMVRIQAALALGFAQPAEIFKDYQNLMPVLGETLNLHAGMRDALIVDPDSGSANVIAGALRDEGYAVIVTNELLSGLQQAREQTPGIDVIFLASDVSNPDLAGALESLRGEFRFAATPVVIITKEAQQGRVRDLVRADHRLGETHPGDEAEEINEVVAQVSGAVGAESITADRGVALAKEAVEVLRLFAAGNNPLFSPAELEVALLNALSTEDDELRIAVANVLAHIHSGGAQNAVALIALDTETAEPMRVAMFGALAEAAKRNGALLDPAHVDALIKIAESDENMVIRTAASQALGALNLPGNPASQIIRNTYGG